VVLKAFGALAAVQLALSGGTAIRACCVNQSQARVKPAYQENLTESVYAMTACVAAGPALADSVQGPPINNQTDGAQTGKTRANYPGLGDVSINLCLHCNS